jgi:diacylglycerol kinase (ATP)
MKYVDWKETLRPARYVRAIALAVSGIKQAYAGEPAFRIEVIASVFLIPSAFYVGKTDIEVIILIGSILLVMITELLNSSVEAVVDRVSLDIHPLSKRAKDIASSAVLISIINALTTWFIILF